MYKEIKYFDLDKLAEILRDPKIDLGPWEVSKVCELADRFGEIDIRGLVLLSSIILYYSDNYYNLEVEDVMNTIKYAINIIYI